MSHADAPDAIPEAVPIHTPWEEAAVMLEQAARVTRVTPELAYLLAVSYKRQGKLGEARAALRKIDPPDDAVLLQLGLLSYQERAYAQAAGEFGQALDKNGQSYPAAYNLLLCRLSLGEMDAVLELLPRVTALADADEEKSFLALLEALLRRWQSSARPADAGNNGDLLPAYQALAGMTAAQERRLLDLLTGLGRFDTVFPLLQTLAAARPDSPTVQQTYLELVLVQARRHAERCEWAAADNLLTPLARAFDAADDLADRVAYLNLHGVCACMRQDFERAAGCFAAAVRLAGDDAWLYQNLALSYELMNRMDQAELHWSRYFDLLDARTPAPPIAGYRENLAYTGLTRLADLYAKQEKWASALGYIQRAARIRPRDVEALERLFHAYVQVRRPEDARRVLRKMRELEPNDPQLDLYELDLREVRSLEDIDRVLTDIKRVLGRHPGDMRVEDRAVAMVLNCVPLIGRKCDQLSDKLAHIVDQVRRLPNYQINWPVVHDEMHYLRHEFQKLRRLSNKCLALVSQEEQRRVIRELNELIDQKIDVCISMGG